jgi:Holliday junction resolvase
LGAAVNVVRERGGNEVRRATNTGSTQLLLDVIAMNQGSLTTVSLAHFGHFGF